MSKTVISVRLSETRLAQLDAAADQLGVNRSEAIDMALRIFPDLISGKCELKFDPSQLGNRSPGGAGERIK